MFRFIRRATGVAAVALLPVAVLVPAAHADIKTFADPGGHITSVRVSNGPSTVGITANDRDIKSARFYRFWIDTDPKDPGPEYLTEVYPDSDGFALEKVASFSSPGKRVRCNGLRAQASADGPKYAKIIVPRNCMKTPGKVRVSVVGYYTKSPKTDWAPGTRKFFPYVNR